MTLDRESPTRRPNEPRSGTQRWRELLFLHWSFPVDDVRALVPPNLAIDTWGGRAWVGLVPFAMHDVRAAFMPRGSGLDFLETNVRTYVVHEGVPGVYFFSLEAGSLLAVLAARIGWGLPYHHADMDARRRGRSFAYVSRRRRDPLARLRVDWEIGEALGPSALGTFEHFLLERYVLYASRRGELHRGRVHHAPYPAARARVLRLEDGLVRAAGLRPRGAPEAVHYAEGVDVEVFGPNRVRSR